MVPWTELIASHQPHCLKRRAGRPLTSSAPRAARLGTAATPLLRREGDAEQVRCRDGDVYTGDQL